MDNTKPFKKGYRHYNIKTVVGPDDYASMAEVIYRRYKRLLEEEAELPQLIVVDGGKGQLSSATRELKRLGMHGLPIIGLAKEREEIFRPGESEPLLLAYDTGALKLLQRILDEAHRLANLYNELLLRKRMKESLLDDCPGVSPKRKEALLKKFGSVARLRRASPGQIAELPGISLRSAARILEWLGD